MQRFDGLRFLFITGKGGVGKSTLAAACGLSLAQRGKKTLVVSARGPGPWEAGTGAQLVTTPRRVANNLYVVRIEPEEAMQEYVQEVVGSRLVAESLFKQKVSRGFLTGIPGLSAWALLGKAWYYGQPQRPRAALPEAPFDVVVLDAPATGDSTDLLRVPRVIAEMAPPGRLRRDAEACWEMLRDPRQTALFPVTLLEELPVTETLELLAVVREDLQLPVGALFVNQTRAELLPEEVRNKVLQVELEQLPPTERSTWEAARFTALREQQALRERERLVASGVHLVEIPFLGDSPQGVARLSEIVQFLENSLHFSRPE